MFSRSLKGPKENEETEGEVTSLLFFIYKHLLETEHQVHLCGGQQEVR